MLAAIPAALTVAFHSPSDASTVSAYCSLSEMSNGRVTFTIPVFGSMANGAAFAYAVSERR